MATKSGPSSFGGSGSGSLAPTDRAPSLQQVKSHLARNYVVTQKGTAAQCSQFIIYSQQNNKKHTHHSNSKNKHNEAIGSRKRPFTQPNFRSNFNQLGAIKKTTAAPPA